MIVATSILIAIIILSLLIIRYLYLDKIIDIKNCKHRSELLSWVKQDLVKFERKFDDVMRFKYAEYQISFKVDDNYVSAYKAGDHELFVHGFYSTLPEHIKVKKIKKHLMKLV